MDFSFHKCLTGFKFPLLKRPLVVLEAQTADLVRPTSLGKGTWGGRGLSGQTRAGPYLGKCIMIVIHIGSPRARP